MPTTYLSQARVSSYFVIKKTRIFLMKFSEFVIPNLPIFSSVERLESYTVVLMCPMADQFISACIYLYTSYIISIYMYLEPK